MDPWEVAQAQVATKYDPQQNMLQRQYDQARANTTTNEQAIQGYGNTGRGIIGETYGKLYDWLNYGKATQQQDLGQAVNATNAAYDRSIADIQGYQQQSRSYLNDMARALGQEGAGLRSNTELENLVNTQLGRASSARTNYGTSLQDWTTKMGTIADMGISSAHQAEAQGRTDFETMLLEMLGKNKLAGTTQETDAMNKISDIMGLRQSDLIAMYNELAQAEWERQFKQAELAQQASIAQAQLDQAAAEGAANRAASGDSELDWAKFYEGQRQFGINQSAEDRAAALGQSNWQAEYDLKKNPGLSLSDRLSYVGTLKDMGALPKTRDAKGNIVDDTSQIEALINNGPEYFNQWREEQARRATSMGPQSNEYYMQYGITPTNRSPAYSSSRNYMGPSWLRSGARHALFGAPSVLASLTR